MFEQNLIDDETSTNKVILYGHAACFGVPPARQMLQKTGVPFEYINIHHNTEAAARVRSINNGNESVPTLVFPDGSTLTEPSAWVLRRKLTDLGYQVGFAAILLGNMWWIVIGVGVLLALLRAWEIF